MIDLKNLNIILTGATGIIGNSILEKLYKFYLTTIDKKWSYDYLTKDFFLNLKNYLKDNFSVIFCEICIEMLKTVSSVNIYILMVLTASLESIVIVVSI